MKIIKIIPFRLQSNRFPNKAISKYFGVTLIENALHISNNISSGETLIACSFEDYNITKSYLNNYKDKEISIVDLKSVVLTKLLNLKNE